MGSDIALEQTPFIQEFWAKASSSNPAGSSTPSIAYHCLDVAAVASELIARDQDGLRRIAVAIEIDLSALTGALPFFLTL